MYRWVCESGHRRWRKRPQSPGERWWCRRCRHLAPTGLSPGVILRGRRGLVRDEWPVWDDVVRAVEER